VREKIVDLDTDVHFPTEDKLFVNQMVILCSFYLHKRLCLKTNYDKLLEAPFSSIVFYKVKC